MMTCRWLLVNQVLLLSYIVFCDMTCNIDGVKCFANPTSCTADCDYLLKYKAASSDTTQIEISGKPSAHGLGTSNLWLAYGFSSTGRMSGMTVYACQKYGEFYTAKKRATTGYGVSSSSTNIATSGVEGSLTDGVMTCKYTINNSELPSGDLKMGYGMGSMWSSDGMSKHNQKPKRSTDSFSLVQEYTPPPSGCSKPTVPNGSVSPDTDTIESGSKYTVTCSSGYTISGVAEVTCTDGTLSSLPTCNPSPCSKPTIQDGTVTPDKATVESGSTYQVSCNSGFTISGSPTITCTNGQLSTYPTCQPSPCSKPTIQDGTVTPDAATVESGSTYQVSCNSGFTISGSPTITCTNGQLSTFPTCQPSEDKEDKKDPKECDVTSGDCYDHHSGSIRLLKINHIFTLVFSLILMILWWTC